MSIEIQTKIKYLRKRRGLTQEELGQKVGVAKATINRYEAGVVPNIKCKMIEKLAYAPETSPALFAAEQQLQQLKRKP